MFFMDIIYYAIKDKYSKIVLISPANLGLKFHIIQSSLMY